MEQWSFNDVVPFNLIVGVYKKRQTKNATTRFAKLSWAFALFSAYRKRRPQQQPKQQ